MFSVPTKAINDDDDFASFTKSQTCKDILDFVKDCADAVVGGDKVSIECDVPKAVKLFVDFMEKLHDMVDVRISLQIADFHLMFHFNAIFAF